MMTRGSGQQSMFFFVDWDYIVPEGHLLRRINDEIDFRFIYDMVEHLYSPFGRPSIDPVVLFKMLLVGALYGVRSERQLEQAFRENLAWRWFAGLHADDSIPDHSVFSQNRRRRFRDSSVIEQIFTRVVLLCVEKGLVTGDLVVTDSTHIKANVTDGKNEIIIQVAKATSEYLQALDAEADRLEAELSGRPAEEDDQTNPPDKQPPTESVEVKINTVDPDARLMKRTGKPSGYYYLTHQSLDAKHGIILDVHTTPGNVNDHEPYAARLEYIEGEYGLTIKHVAADRGYDEMNVHRHLNRLGIKGFIPRKVKRGPAKTFRKDRFTYVPGEDSYLCPGGKRLRLNHISRKIHQKVYTANPADCKGCPLREECVAPTARRKNITRPLFQDYADITYSRIGTAAYRAAQRLRRIWCEGTFGLQKRFHNLDRARMRGLSRVHEQSIYSAIAVNLRRMIKAQPRLA